MNCLLFLGEAGDKGQGLQRCVHGHYLTAVLGRPSTADLFQHNDFYCSPLTCRYVETESCQCNVLPELQTLDFIPDEIRIPHFFKAQNRSQHNPIIKVFR